MTVKTQIEHFWASHNQIAVANRHVMEMIHDEFNPLTQGDLHRLADAFPERWGKYRGLLDPKEAGQ